MIKTATVATAAIALAAIVSTPSFAASKFIRTGARTPAFGLTSNGPGVQEITTHCSSILSCNVLISLCAEWGGVWTETGRPGPHGEPQKGACVH